MVSKLETMLQKVMSEVPECVATGYVDMATGMLLAARTIDSHPREVLDLVAAATADLFQGSTVSAIERLFRKSRGVKDDGHHYFQEIIVFSDNLLHVFLRGRKNNEHVVTFVCRKSANVGMVLTKTRLALPTIESSV
ncbi:MAG: hypothetical protein JNM83_22665 [Myxococcales bacterium]|jgi:hypothetical protein|nr:hypothetical protein [Myxococcales bacterium]